MKTKILIVEDDPHILLGLEEVLKSEGYETASCHRGDETFAAVGKFQPALIVLDVMLPGASGYDLCKQLRAKKNPVPVLMLTAKGQEIDKVIGLDLGADDYVTKPFGVRELLARIQALLRRSNKAGEKNYPEQNFKIGSATIDPKTFQIKRGKTIEELTAKGQEIDKVIGLDLGADDYVTKPFGVRELLARIQALLRRSGKVGEKNYPEQNFKIGSATIDPKTFQIKRGKVVEELTAKELKLLQIFHAHAGEVLSRDKLLNEIWGYNYYGTTRTLDQVIVQLRKKLGDNEPKHLLTIHGVGYKLADATES